MHRSRDIRLYVTLKLGFGVSQAHTKREEEEEEEE